jgi:hypothetical protein
MSFTTTPVIGELRQRMIEDMNGRKLGRHCQRGHIASCKRFAGYLKRSPDTATADDVRLFQLHLIESGTSICNRNRVMTHRYSGDSSTWHMERCTCADTRSLERRGTRRALRSGS